MTTSSKATRTLGVLVLAGIAALLLFGLVLSPADEVQGDSVRLMYVHVPSAWLAYAAFLVTATSGLLYLIRRTRSRVWDRLAASSAEVGVVFTGLAILTGMIWGRPTWGVYWTWDARLTSTSVLFIMYLGYLALRRLPGDPDVRAKRAAVVGLVAFVNVPIVHMSVLWWRTLHQEPTLARLDLDPTIDDLMLFTLFLGLVVFTLLYVWLMVHRYRLAWLEDRVDDEGLERAIAERRAEAAADGALVGPAGSAP
ncbi:MAG: cytochrome c biogenesis protein CcsA [Acidimicrobiales bacterium]|nr:cytochrome c biogenesis protein CcsA [Acidimicrobiales bacterium]